jgi:ankyrin repeat protein
MTPLGCACIRGRVGVVKVLLDGGADWRKKIFTTGKNLGVNPLFSACVNQHVDVARVLLARGLFDYDKDDVNTTFYVVRDAECSPDLKALFDSYFANYWQLRARLRCIGRPSEPQRRVVGDPYLANHLGSFLFGDGIILEREDAPDAPSARRASPSAALASSMAEVRAALGDGAGNPSLLAQLKQSLSDAARVVELEAAREAALGDEDRAERLGPELAELTGLLQRALSLQASPPGVDPGS